jgi:hypothetical protein
MSASNNEWTTVASSQRRTWGAPSAAPSTTFSGSRRPQTEAPAAFARRTDARPAPPRVDHGAALRTERAAEATRAAALNFTSMDAYPALGGARAAPTSTARPPTLDFRAAAATGAAATATAAADAYEEEYARRRRERLAAEEAERARRARLAAIGTRTFDDGPEDYDGPVEDEDDTYVPAGAGTTDDWEDASGGVIEEDQVAVRRRGDKGVW